MKLKRRMGMGLAVAAATYCVLAYIFMWPPVVLYYANWHSPNSSADACLNNLRQIDAAINQFALEHNKPADDLVSFSDLTPYIKLDSHGQIPSCPAGGTYVVQTIGMAPTCSLATNPITKIRINYFFYYFSRGPHKLP